MGKTFSKNKLYRKGLADTINTITADKYKPYAKKGHKTSIIKNKNFTISEVDEDVDIFRFCISSEAIDRDGDIVLQKGIKYDNYIKNPVVFWGHKWDSVPIGKVIAVTYDETEKKTYADVVLGSTGNAQEIKTLIKEGIVQATSIGFYINDWDYDDKLGAYVLKDTELLELSLVGLPANQDATFSEEKEYELEVGEKGTQVKVAGDGTDIRDENNKPINPVDKDEKSLSEEQIREIVAEAIAVALNPVEEEVEPEEEVIEEDNEQNTEVTASTESSIAEQLATLTELIQDALQNINGESGEGAVDPEPEEDSDTDSGSNDSEDEDDNDDNTPIIILAE